MITIPHLLVDAFDCDGPLDDAEAIQQAMVAAAEAVGAQVVGQGQHRYVPHGVTAVLFLAESHILVTTWPENNTALFDILLCNETMDTGVAAEILLKAMGAKRSVQNPVRRILVDG